MVGSLARGSGIFRSFFPHGVRDCDMPALRSVTRNLKNENKMGKMLNFGGNKSSGEELDIRGEQ